MRWHTNSGDLTDINTLSARWRYTEHRPRGPCSKFCGLLQVRSAQEKAERCVAWNLAWTPLSNHLQSASPGHGSPLRQDAPGTAGFSAPSNGIRKHLCKGALRRRKVTGQLLDSRASPWHQYAHGVSSIYSLAIICELFGFFSNVPSLPCSSPSPLPPPALLSDLCVCGEIDI